MKRGAIIGLIIGGISGILLGVCIVWIGLIFDDSSDGVAPLIAFGAFSAAISVGFFTSVGAIVGAIVNAVSSKSAPNRPPHP